MCDQDVFEHDRQEFEQRGLITRRQFGLVIAAGASMPLPLVLNPVSVDEREVVIETPDGKADATFIYPSKGTAPAVLMWPDIFGLRPSFKAMAKRLAESGYAVLVVNPFYRVKAAPTAASGTNTPIAELRPLAAELTASTHTRDAQAFIKWLDAQPVVAKDRKIGTQGYCMGGPIAFRTAAAVPNRVGAVATFHASRLVTDDVQSPAQMVVDAKSQAQFLIAIAENDDKRSPNDKVRLRETFDGAKLTAEIEVYAGAAHGWCPPDSAVYNEPMAEKAWTRLLALYKQAL